MVEKVSVNVKVISLNVEHNFLIPFEMSVNEATNLVVQALLEEYPGVRPGYTGGYTLVQLSSGKALTASCSLKQLGILQGEKLLLV